MQTFLVISMCVSIVFHFVMLHVIGKTIRTIMYNHNIFASLAILGTDFMMLIFIGAGNIVGIANLAGGVALGAWVCVRGAFCKERVVLQWKRCIPQLVIKEKSC